MLKCTFPACTHADAAERMWLPEEAALMRANLGKAVPVTDFPKHALCRRHGDMLRQEGPKVFRYQASVERAGQQEQNRREAEQRKGFIARYAPTAAKSGAPTPAQPPLRRLSADPRNVNGGLSKLSREDAKKRVLAQAEAAKHG